MRKTLVTLALAAVPALIFSACNGSAGGGSGMSPSAPNAAPQYGRVHRADNGPSSLHAGGATFPAYAYNFGAQPVGSYNQTQEAPPPGSLFYSYGGTGTIYYCLTGSGFGRKDFTGQSITSTDPCAALGQSATGFGGRTDPLDFIGSDVPLFSAAYTSEPDCCNAGTEYYEHRLCDGNASCSPALGQPFEIPTIGGPIVYPYQTADDDLPPVSNPGTINLSQWTYCAIANGTVTSWDDPAITADNGGNSVTGGISEQITFYYRTDGSGTSYWFQNHLTAACNGSWSAPYNAAPYQSGSRTAAWTGGVSLSWGGLTTCNPLPAACFEGASGNPGIIAGIQATPWSTGYAEGAWAAAATGTPISQAILQNQNGETAGGGGFESPTDASAVSAGLSGVTAAHIEYGEGADGNPLESTEPYCQLVIDPSDFQNPTGSGAYPIVAISYWLFYQYPPAHLTDQETLVKFLASKKGNNVIDKIQEYQPLPTGIHTAILGALKGNKKQKHNACLTT
ncbi:MAG TPA: substrate-binding domain-containing protein [Candidatus Babeliales bacterium]|nr:substrate-binding domain-containing protein [Candidatus Babeliales bacterium]